MPQWAPLILFEGFKKSAIYIVSNIPCSSLPQCVFAIIINIWFLWCKLLCLFIPSHPILEKLSQIMWKYEKKWLAQEEECSVKIIPSFYLYHHLVRDALCKEWWLLLHFKAFIGSWVCILQFLCLSITFTYLPWESTYMSLILHVDMLILSVGYE